MPDLIALPLVNGRLSAHFGHAPTFAFVEIDGASIRQRELTPPPHAPGVLPRWLAEQGATVLIAGGIGPKAVELLEASGIRCLLGVPALTIDEAIAHYRQQNLPTGQVSCNHGPDHACDHG